MRKKTVFVMGWSHKAQKEVLAGIDLFDSDRDCEGILSNGFLVGMLLKPDMIPVIWDLYVEEYPRDQRHWSEILSLHHFPLSFGGELRTLYKFPMTDPTQTIAHQVDELLILAHEVAVSRWKY